ncbi:MAG: YIP1 family protein [Bdellovibrionales bacterium]|nr:YIP1 family protein [Bdellovibrionales bacterium]
MATEPPQDPSLDAAAPRWERPTDFFRRFLRDLKDVHLNPTAFFSSLPPSGSLGGPLAFALIVHWFGTGLEFFWDQVTGNTFQRRAEEALKLLQEYSEIDTVSRDLWMQRTQDAFTQFLMGAGTVIADPFLTLVGILITGGLGTLGAKLLVPDDPARGAPPVTFETTVRVICYGTAPSILNALPYLGGMASKLWILIATVIGFREVYRVSGGRAFVIAVFPKLLLFGAVFAVLLFVALLMIGLFSAALS